MTATVLERLNSAGLTVALIEDGLIGVSPKDRLTDDLRALIRSQREVILAALRPAVPVLNVSPASDPVEPTDWRTFDRVYQRHHLTCVTCISAGLGYGMRCGVGAPLWQAYSD
jgi:hypothetical protein